MVKLYRHIYIDHVLKSCKIWFSINYSQWFQGYHILNLENFYEIACFCQNASRDINPFPNKPWFLRVCRKSLFENTVGKGEIAHNEQFLLFP